MAKLRFGHSYTEPRGICRSRQSASFCSGSYGRFPKKFVSGQKVRLRNLSVAEKQDEVRLIDPAHAGMSGVSLAPPVSVLTLRAWSTASRADWLWVKSSSVEVSSSLTGCIAWSLYGTSLDLATL